MMQIVEISFIITAIKDMFERNIQYVNDQATKKRSAGI